MASLREQVQDEARRAKEWDQMGMSNLGHHRMAGADIASDRWEPLLRELAEAVESDFSPHQSRGARTARALARAKEALGE